MSNLPTVNSPTIATAPRDVTALKVTGRFHLRRLAEALGLLSTDALKTSFMSMAPDAMAESVCQGLRLWDANNGGGAAQPQAPAPVAQQLAPAPAPAAAPAPTGRQPRTKSSESNGQDHTDNSQVLAAITALTVEVQKLSSTNAALSAKVDDIQKKLDDAQRLQLTGVALNLMLAEEVLKAPRPDVLETALADVQGIGQMIAGK
jgi:hypothetical protein